MNRASQHLSGTGKRKEATSPLQKCPYCRAITSRLLPVGTDVSLSNTTRRICLFHWIKRELCYEPAMSEFVLMVTSILNQMKKKGVEPYSSLCRGCLSYLDKVNLITTCKRRLQWSTREWPDACPCGEDHEVAIPGHPSQSRLCRTQSSAFAWGGG